MIIVVVAVNVRVVERYDTQSVDGGDGIRYFFDNLIRRSVLSLKADMPLLSIDSQVILWVIILD